MPRGVEEGDDEGVLVVPPPPAGTGWRSDFVPPQWTRKNTKERTAAILSEEYLGFGRVTLHETPVLLSGVAS